MTFVEGITMALILSGIGLPLVIFAYYKAFKNYENKERDPEFILTDRHSVDKHGGIERWM